VIRREIELIYKNYRFVLLVMAKSIIPGLSIGGKNPSNNSSIFQALFGSDLKFDKLVGDPTYE
jgi:hypothetical protein